MLFMSALTVVPFSPLRVFRLGVGLLFLVDAEESEGSTGAEETADVGVAVLVAGKQPLVSDMEDLHSTKTSGLGLQEMYHLEIVCQAWGCLMSGPRWP